MEWIRDQFGIFPEHGFSSDPMYPETFNNGTVEIDNIGCKDLDEKVSPHSPMAYGVNGKT